MAATQGVGFSWLFFVWMGSVIGQLGVGFVGMRIRYWYELGELLFLVPFVVLFIVGGGLF